MSIGLVVGGGRVGGMGNDFGCGFTRGHRSAGGGMPLFLGFAGEGSLDGCAGRGIAGRSGNDFGCGRDGFGEQGVGRVDQGANQIGRRDRRGLQGFVVIEHPAGEKGFAAFLDPLIDQSGDFISKVGCVIEAREFKTLQGSARCGLQVVEGRSESGNGHGQGSNLVQLGQAQKGKPVKALVNGTKLS